MKQSKVEVQKRQNRILELFQNSDALQVTDVSKLLNVSEITVRRDFDYLEKKGYITRFHGGAKLNLNRVDVFPKFENKGEQHGNEKSLIAQVVSGMIHDHDTVFLNAGTTTLEVIKCIKEKHVRVITNNAIAIGVIPGGNLEFICTGGVYNENSRSFVGDLSTPLLNKVYANVCVLGVNGISSKDGVTTYAYPETMINELMVKRCKGLKIVAADGSKIGKTYCFTSSLLNNIDVLVTDSSADLVELEKIKECGVRIMIADQNVS